MSSLYQPCAYTETPNRDISFNLLKQKYRRTPPALTKPTAYSKKMCPQPTFPTTITVFSSKPSRWSGFTRAG